MREYAANNLFTRGPGHHVARTVDTTTPFVSSCMSASPWVDECPRADCRNIRVCLTTCGCWRVMAHAFRMLPCFAASQVTSPRTTMKPRQGWGAFYEGTLEESRGLFAGPMRWRAWRQRDAKHPVILWGLIVPSPGGIALGQVWPSFDKSYTM